MCIHTHAQMHLEGRFIHSHLFPLPPTIPNSQKVPLHHTCYSQTPWLATHFLSMLLSHLGCSIDSFKELLESHLFHAPSLGNIIPCCDPSWIRIVEQGQKNHLLELTKSPPCHEDVIPEWKYQHCWAHFPGMVLGTNETTLRKDNRNYKPLWTFYTFMTLCYEK